MRFQASCVSQMGRQAPGVALGDPEGWPCACSHAMEVWHNVFLSSLIAGCSSSTQVWILFEKFMGLNLWFREEDLETIMFWCLQKKPDVAKHGDVHLEPLHLGRLRQEDCK